MTESQPVCRSAWFTTHDSPRSWFALLKYARQADMDGSDAESPHFITQLRIGRWDGEKVASAGTRGRQIAEKLGFRRTAPKGASQFKELTASLKRCPDTNPIFSAGCKAPGYFRSALRDLNHFFRFSQR